MNAGFSLTLTLTAKKSVFVEYDFFFFFFFYRGELNENQKHTHAYRAIRSTLSSSCDQDEATSTQGPPLLSFAFSPSLASYDATRFYLATLCLKFC